MRLSALLPFPALAAVTLLSGCALTNTAAPSLATGISLHGSVHGGQQAITGARVYLLAANTSGYGQASVSLLNATTTGQGDSIGGYVTSDSTGFFTITGDYACTSGQQVYLYALGGNPGGGANTASGLLAVLGACPGTGNFLASIPNIQINEVTTIAAAYALSGFATDATHVSSSGTPLAQTDVANAFLNAAQLASVVTGAALTTNPAGNATVPQSEINTLANILASCVNSTGPTTPPATPATCNTLFSNAMNGSTAPTDTASAAINIAHNPGANIATLYAIPAAASPFAPVLSAQPHDFTIAISFTGGGINAPTDIDFDTLGNAWIVNENGNSIGEIIPGGAFAPGQPFSGNGLHSPYHGAFDLSGNLWVTNNGSTAGPLSEFTSTGAAAPGSPFTGNGIDDPWGIAVDPSGNIWVANIQSAGTISKFTPAGAAATGSPFTVNGLNAPWGIAIQPLTGNVWITNSGNNTVAKLTSAGVPVSGSPFSAGGINVGLAIAFDSSTNVWIANTGNHSLSELTSSGTAVTGSPFTTTSQNATSNNRGIAIDGAGNVWVPDILHNYITENAPSGAAVPGSPFSTPAGPINITVDGSGNVWVPNGASSSSNVTEFIGASVPVVTPLVAGVANNTLGTRP